MSEQGWIGVDLDGTLAQYDKWRGIEHIGEPIPAMVERVKAWIAEGREVRIFTARIAEDDPEVFRIVRQWCLAHVGYPLPITCRKDFGMVELWDDRAVQVVKNTGIALQDCVVDQEHRIALFRATMAGVVKGAERSAQHFSQKGDFLNCEVERKVVKEVGKLLDAGLLLGVFGEPKED